MSKIRVRFLRPSKGNQNLPFNPRNFLTVYFYSLPSRPSLCSARFLSSSSDMTTIFLQYRTTTGVRAQSFICFVNNMEFYTHTMSSLLTVHTVLLMFATLKHLQDTACFKGFVVESESLHCYNSLKYTIYKNLQLYYFSSFFFVDNLNATLCFIQLKILIHLWQSLRQKFYLFPRLPRIMSFKCIITIITKKCNYSLHLYVRRFFMSKNIIHYKKYY